MSKTMERVDYSCLELTGVELLFSLNTSLVTLEEAEAFVGFLNRTVSSVLEAWEKDAGEPLGLIPIVEIHSGSMHLKIHFAVVKEFALAVAAELAAHVVWTIVCAVIPSSTIAEPPQLPQHAQAIVDQCAPVAQSHLAELVKVLQGSGKPFRLEITQGIVVVEGNQSTHPPGSSTPVKTRNYKI